MKLLDYMKRQGLDDAAFAASLGADVTARAVKKWKYGETTPRLPEIVRISDVTNGAVTPNDFLSPPAERHTHSHGEAAE